MKGIFARLPALVIALFLASSLQALDWISASEAAQILGLSVKRDAQSDRVFLQGTRRDGLQIGVTFVAGMDRILFNGEVYRIPKPARYSKGSLELPRASVEALAIKLLRARTSPLPPPPMQHRGFGALQGAGWKVVLDPGHGGAFRGTMSAGGLTEKFVNLEVALEASRILREQGVEVILTRSSDTSLHANLNQDLSARADVANRNSADVFVSIHSNRASNTAARGIELYVVNSGYSVTRRSPPVYASASRGPYAISDGAWSRPGYSGVGTPEASPSGSTSYDLARKIEASMTSSLGERSRGIRDDRALRVLRECRLPAVLVEIGFLSNPQTEEKLKEENYRRQMGSAIANGILGFLSANTVGTTYQTRSLSRGSGGYR